MTTTTMWRRASSQLKTLALRRSHHGLARPNPNPIQTLRDRAVPSTTPLFSSVSDTGLKKTVEDVMPIATGLEREELAAELEGRKRFDMDAPVGPFGTKEAPAVIQSYYNKRIVGCPGGEGEDERMNMTSSGSGWRRTSLMSALCAPSTLCLR